MSQHVNAVPAPAPRRSWIPQWAARRLPALPRWRQRLTQWLDPGLPGWRFAAWAVIAAVLSTLALHIVPIVTDTTVPNWPAILYLLGLVLLSAVIALALLIAARLLFALPLFYRCCLVAGAGVLLPLFGYYATDRGAQVAAGAVLLAASLLGAGLAGIVLWRRRPSRALRALTVAATLAGLGFIAAATWWLLDSGQGAEPRVFAQAGPGIVPLDAPDPSRSGPLAFTTLTYGSGNDRHRREYGGGADLVTASVDASKLVSWDDRPATIRARYWGFDTDELPLQGRVWLPEGDGPFPLVLIVHGNHLMEDFSDAGYAYLGEQLASHGYIAVSVDQNFINTGIADLYGGTANENDARGWLLLEHLRLWHEWNASPGHRFSGKLDPTRIALIGHSRGGEAVAVAAAFNHLPRYPDDATVAFDYGYDIRAVAAIAPVDGQYRPGRIGTPLRDVNYLTLQGGHDGDMTSFEGARQYDRVVFSDGFEGFKAAIHIPDANHGQFNSDWGRLDITRPFGWLLDVAPLIPAREQQHATRVYIGAFLEVALRDDARYLPLLGSHHAGAHWLPHNAYASEFALAGQRIIAGFDEDLDLHSATLPGATISQQGLSDWREQRIPMRRGQRNTGAVFLGWTDAGEAPAQYAIAVPDGAANGMASLTFSVADTGGTPTRSTDEQDAHADADTDDSADGDDRAEEDAARNDDARATIDLAVRLTDAAGNTATLPLSHQSPLLPVERPNLFKSKLVRASVNPEPVFQTYTFALADFTAAGSGFDATSVREVAFVFDRTPEGFVALNHVAFNPARRQAPKHRSARMSTCRRRMWFRPSSDRPTDPRTFPVPWITGQMGSLCRSLVHVGGGLHEPDSQVGFEQAVHVGLVREADDEQHPFRPG